MVYNGSHYRHGGHARAICGRHRSRHIVSDLLLKHKVHPAPETSTMVRSRIIQAIRDFVFAPVVYLYWFLLSFSILVCTFLAVACACLCVT